MSLKCGIIGLPNIGKSSLFNALTKSNIPAENYPFCTIDPNSGLVQVPDSRLDKLDNMIKPKAKVEAIMEFTDIAGLVKGASQGQGLGNQFLSHIRQTDALIHVVRAFEDEDVIHVSKKVSPQDDIMIVETELALADLEQCQRVLEKTKKNQKVHRKSQPVNYQSLMNCLIIYQMEKCYETFHYRTRLSKWSKICSF